MTEHDVLGLATDAFRDLVERDLYRLIRHFAGVRACMALVAQQHKI